MRSYLKTLEGEERSFGETSPTIECFRCGICCIDYQPQVTGAEIELIAGRLSMSADEVISQYVMITQVGYLLRRTESGCVFLTQEKDTSKVSCAIYSSRPEICRSWVPSLSKPQCRAGLVKLRMDNGILLVGEIYENQEQAEMFCRTISASQEK